MRRTHRHNTRTTVTRVVPVKKPNANIAPVYATFDDYLKSLFTDDDDRKNMKKWICHYLDIINLPEYDNYVQIWNADPNSGCYTFFKVLTSIMNKKEIINVWGGIRIDRVDIDNNNYRYIQYIKRKDENIERLSELLGGKLIIVVPNSDIDKFKDNKLYSIHKFNPGCGTVQLDYAADFRYRKNEVYNELFAWCNLEFGKQTQQDD